MSPPCQQMMASHSPSFYPPLAVLSHFHFPSSLPHFPFTPLSHLLRPHIESATHAKAKVSFLSVSVDAAAGQSFRRSLERMSSSGTHAKSIVQWIVSKYQDELGSKRGRYHREYVLIGNVREVAFGLVSANLYSRYVQSSLIMLWVVLLFVDSALIPLVYFATKRARSRKTSVYSGTRPLGKIAEILLDMGSLVIQAQIWGQIKLVSDTALDWAPDNVARGGGSGGGPQAHSIASESDPATGEFVWQMITLITSAFRISRHLMRVPHTWAKWYMQRKERLFKEALTNLHSTSFRFKSSHRSSPANVVIELGALHAGTSTDVTKEEAHEHDEEGQAPPKPQPCLSPASQAKLPYPCLGRKGVVRIMIVQIMMCAAFCIFTASITIRSYAGYLNSGSQARDKYGYVWEGVWPKVRKREERGEGEHG